jgi:hypothetical protein
LEAASPRDLPALFVVAATALRADSTFLAPLDWLRVEPLRDLWAAFDLDAELLLRGVLLPLDPLLREPPPDPLLRAAAVLRPLALVERPLREPDLAPVFAFVAAI